MTSRQRSGADASASRVWPTGTDYARVVQSPGTAFVDPFLGASTLGVGQLGMPLVASGQNAVVFLLTTELGDRAIRCFLRPPTHGADRYSALARHVGEAAPLGLTAAVWDDQGIKVNGECWPLVVMPWVAGTPLNAAVEDMIDEPHRIQALASDWADMVRGLQAANVAHGDLQHGNVLVKSDGALALVDLDGVWVPEITVGAPAESGHPNYQHPQRTSAHWGRYVDSYPAALIELALKALAVDPALARFLQGENLLFSRSDLTDPDSSELWTALEASPDADVAAAAAQLRRGCQAPIEEVLIPFDDLRDAPFAAKQPTHFAPSLLPTVKPEAPAASMGPGAPKTRVAGAAPRRSWTTKTKVLVGALSAIALVAATLAILSQVLLADTQDELAAAQAELVDAAQAFQTEMVDTRPEDDTVYSGQFSSSGCTGWIDNADVCAQYDDVRLSLRFTGDDDLSLAFTLLTMRVQVDLSTAEGGDWSGSGLGSDDFSSCDGRVGGPPTVEALVRPSKLAVDPTSHDVSVAVYHVRLKFTTAASSCDPAYLTMIGDVTP